MFLGAVRDDYHSLWAVAYRYTPASFQFFSLICCQQLSQETPIRIPEARKYYGIYQHDV